MACGTAGLAVDRMGGKARLVGTDTRGRGSLVFPFNGEMVAAGKAFMRIQRFLVLMVLSCGLLGMADAQTVKNDELAIPQLGQELGDDGKLWGNTKPSEKAEMSVASRSSDVVLDVRVKKGDFVKPGQILAVEDIREEEAELRTTELLANSEVAVRAAEATAKQKELEVKRMTGKENVFTQYEVDKAKLDLDLAQLDIEKAQLDQAKFKSQAEQLRTQISRKQLVSRISGVVREINIEKGAVIDPQKPAIIVINNQPLWVEVHVPIEMSLRLIELQQANKKLDFGVMLPGAKKATPANVIFIDPEADPAGKSQRWVLEMPNNQQVPSGLRLQVIPPQLDKVAEAKVK
jgi:HlyD family secretion protein